MVSAGSFHRWENNPAVVIAGGSSESVSPTFIGKWVDRATLWLSECKCTSSWLVVGLSVSLGSMTEVMNSCDSAVGDYSVSGASEEENISLQVGCASLGQLAECSLETHISDLFKRNKANETQKHVKANIYTVAGHFDYKYRDLIQIVFLWIHEIAICNLICNPCYFFVDLSANIFKATK